ncbi:MAG: hypothetical protein K6F56_04265 [Oscillospiraceae bacterium]|nr:hypothetical protein [Oscillospiraceae bacterium]
MRKRALPCLLCALLLGLTLCACGRREETTEVLVTAAEPAPRETYAESLAGDWYGWWHITHTSGDWAKMYGDFWDCCAEIDEDGHLLLWDEVLTKDNCLAETTLVRTDGGLRCVGGSMLDAPREPESWELAVTQDGDGTLLTISGHYDAVEKEGGFSYEIFLRPWGSLWPGKESEIPYYYEDWYLPLIRAGSAMPDTIGP